MTGPSTPFSAGDIVAGRYRIGEKLGEGGMAVVFSAVHTGTDKRCALKFIHAHLVSRENALDKFLKEARIAGRIGSHPNIVDVFDTGVDEGSKMPFIAMELLEGITLGELCRRQGPLSWDEVRDVMEQLGEALDEAHKADVVHRDLKPANIFVTQDHKDRRVIKVLDFGIAKILDAGASSTATQIGTPAYCAPEQLGQSIRTLAAERGLTIAKGVSATTDVWATGFIAYELLTGIPPAKYWHVDTLADLMVKVALERHVAASVRAGHLAQRLPEGFDDWFAHCTQHNAVERWPSVGRAVAELGRLFDGAKEVQSPLAGGTAGLAQQDPAQHDLAEAYTTPFTSPEPKLQPEAPPGVSADTNEPWQQSLGEGAPKGTPKWVWIAGATAVLAAAATGVVIKSSGSTEQARPSSTGTDTATTGSPSATASEGTTAPTAEAIEDATAEPVVAETPPAPTIRHAAPPPPEPVATATTPPAPPPPTAPPEPTTPPPTPTATPPPPPSDADLMSGRH